MNDFEVAFEAYPWESTEQREGYLALVQYLMKFGTNPESIDAEMAYMFQKLHESNEYWRDAVGEQVHSLQNQIRTVQDECAGLRREMEHLKELVGSLNSLVKMQGCLLDHLWRMVVGSGSLPTVGTPATIVK